MSQLNNENTLFDTSIILTKLKSKKIIYNKKKKQPFSLQENLASFINSEN